MSTTEDSKSTLAQNVAHWRNRGKYSFRKLSAAMEEQGCPINVDGLNRIEKDKRKVTTDELLALAVVLNVSPLALLLPAEDTGEPVELTPKVSASWQAVRRWGAGETPLPRGEEIAVNDPRVAKFISENRPFEKASTVDEIALWLVSRWAIPFALEMTYDGTGRPKGRLVFGSDPDSEDGELWHG